jgi:cobalt transporter subunit CbtA
VNAFRRLILIAVASGTFAGLLWFGLQYLMVIPLIQDAERYEAAARGGVPEHDEGWHPAGPLQRNSFTAMATVLTGIGFAALLFGVLSLGGRQLNAGRGFLWGLAAFACVALAPSLGLPPQPPGAAVADLGQRQLWWLATVVATAVGLYLVAGNSRAWTWKLCGAICLLLPHAVGAPSASGGSQVPVALMRHFAVASLAAAAVFWLTLGGVGGYLFNRYPAAADPR